MSAPAITKLTFGRNASPLGIGQARPLLSWHYEQDDSTEADWVQVAYELEIGRNNRAAGTGKAEPYKVDSDSCIDIPWPKEEGDLASRERVQVRVRAKGKSGQWTEWKGEVVEAALLHKQDWEAQVVGPAAPPPVNQPKRPFHIRRAFKLPSTETGNSSARGGDDSGRIYATALGVYQLYLNGTPIGDHVQAPGWQSYNHRLHYQTYAIPTDLWRQGENVLEAIVGEGWYAGRLSWNPRSRNIWGSEIGVMAQLEVGGKVVVKTDEQWEWAYGPLLSSELYDGEVYDVSIEPGAADGWGKTKTIPLPSAAVLIAPEAPPIRRTQTIKVKEVITTPSGKTILDFGQNLVGWVKVSSIPAASRPNEAIQLRFAEVLEDQELGVRPLRSAKCTDTIFLGEKGVKEWEPLFTSHGFRYCEVSVPASMLAAEGSGDGEGGLESKFEAVVIHSDMERIGDFECSHEMVNQLHRNVVWGLRGNFVGLPTDCPQRDERLGWTGDLQAFAPTASYLYDTRGFLANWLHDLAEEQIKDSEGIVPLVVPNCLTSMMALPPSQAVWGDVAVITPRDLHQAYGSTTILEEQWESIRTWLDKGIKRGENGLWDNPRNGFQLSDWLDPKAPADDPGASQTDQFLVADAYLVGVTGLASTIASTLGKSSESDRYAAQHKELRKVFQDEYVTPSGRLSSDTQTAYCMAYLWDLLDGSQYEGAAERLIRLVRKGDWRISTGFAGTPVMLHALTQAGHLQVAYRMLQEKGCPSWLYPITMGATTIWERWDSMMPDGSINPGEMTSFNHYALGAVANWLHTTVAGLSPLSPGYKEILIAPRPGGSLTHASTYTITPYGRAAVSWSLDTQKGELAVEFEVPPNTTALMRIGGPGGKEEKVGSGKYSRTVKYEPEGEWPPAPYQTQFSQKQTKDTLAL